MRARYSLLSRGQQTFSGINACCQPGETELVIANRNPPRREVWHPEQLKRASAKPNVPTRHPEWSSRIEEILEDELPVVEWINCIENSQPIGLPPYHLLEANLQVDAPQLSIEKRLTRVDPDPCRIAETPDRIIVSPPLERQRPVTIDAVDSLSIDVGPRHLESSRFTGSPSGTIPDRERPEPVRGTLFGR